MLPLMAVQSIICHQVHLYSQSDSHPGNLESAVQILACYCEVRRNQTTQGKHTQEH